MTSKIKRSRGLIETRKLRKIIVKRIEQMKLDIKVAHLNRVLQSVETDYIDENQAMWLMDHMYRIRCYKEFLDLIDGKVKAN